MRARAMSLGCVLAELAFCSHETERRSCKLASGAFRLRGLAVLLSSSPNDICNEGRKQ
jgi:hypothetical protein